MPTCEGERLTRGSGASHHANEHDTHDTGFNWTLPREIPDYKDISAEAARMPIQECGEPLIALNPILERHGIHVDPRYFNEGLAGAQPTLYGREGVAEKLIRVHNRLRKRDLELGVFDVHRTNRTIADLFERFKATFAQQNQDVRPEDLDEIVRMYAAKPIRSLEDLKNPPPHSTGGAADLFIVRDGKVVYQGAPLDMPVPAARTDYYKYDKTPLGRWYNYTRAVVCEAVFDEGGVIYAEEFWHASWGDQEAAVAHNKPFAIYAATPGLLPRETIEDIPTRSAWLSEQRIK